MASQLCFSRGAGCSSEGRSRKPPLASRQHLREHSLSLAPPPLRRHDHMSRQAFTFCCHSDLNSDTDCSGRGETFLQSTAQACEGELAPVPVESTAAEPTEERQTFLARPPVDLSHVSALQAGPLCCPAVNHCQLPGFDYQCQEMNSHSCDKQRSIGSLSLSGPARGYNNLQIILVPGSTNRQRLIASQNVASSVS